MRRRYLLFVILLAVLTLGWRILGSSGSDQEWIQVNRQDLILGAEVTGTLSATESAYLGPPAISRIYNFKISRLAPEGTEVKRGTPVLGFDTSQLRDRLQNYQNRADSARKEIEKKTIDIEIKNQDSALKLATAEARLRKAELKAQRPPELVADLEFEKAALDLQLAQKELEAVKLEIEAGRRADQAELEGLRADLARAEGLVAEVTDSITRMTVKAPRDGMVIYHTPRWGDKKKVGDDCWRDDTVVEIPDLTQMRAEGEIEEVHSGRIRPGLPVTLSLDAFPDIVYTGVVASISSAVQQRSWRDPVKVVRIDVTLEETDRDRMRPGMRFRGQVETDRITNTLVAPLGAVSQTAEGPAVFLRRLFKSRLTPVEIGRHNRELVELLGGVREGSRIRATRPERGKDR
jgi:hypothetical protein